MTKVHVYGLLGKEFGEEFDFSISAPKDVVAAIDANQEGFVKRIAELAKDGAHYTLIADDQIIGSVDDFVGKRKIKEVFFIPTIFGAGAIGAIVVGVVALGASYYATGVLAAVLVAVAFAAISYGVTSLLAKPPSSNIPGATGTTNATSKSFLFGNRENITAQGNPVPLGYGRLRIGSAVIQHSIKNYPNSISTFDEFTNQATQEGQASMAVLNNQEI